MLTKLCAKCHKVIPYPLQYCEQCRAVAEQTKVDNKRLADSRYNKQRDPKYKAFYNSNEWKMLSNKKLQAEQYRCEKCRRIATEVHHIIEVKDNWDKRLDYDNLMSLCLDCHNKIHGRFQRRRR